MAKPGKYAQVIKELTVSFGLDPDYQKKVNAIMSLIKSAREDGDVPNISEQTMVIEEMAQDVAATLSVLNDMFVASAGGSMRASRLAAIYRNLRLVKKLFEEQESNLNVIIEAYEQVLVEAYENEDVTSLKLEDGASVRVQSEPHGKVIDRDANRKWAIENGLENLLTIPWQTVNALTKEALITEGSEIPAGVEVSARPKVVFTKG